MHDARFTRPSVSRDRRSAGLAGVGALIARRPRRVIAAWLLVVATLAVVGLGLEGKLFTRAVYLDGTKTKQEHEIVVRDFGRENSVVVMLRGPHEQVEAQGRRLAARIESAPHSFVLSPWSPGGSLKGLRPRPTVAALVVNVETDADEALLDILPQVRRSIDETVSRPVHASIAGVPAILESIKSATEHATEVGQWIAIPALLVVLLLVFRSVFAAATPIVVGGSVVMASRGVLALLAEVTHIDVLALGAVGMMGLALGVDYALLVVSRFREETAAGASISEAIEATVVATGRTVLMAGSGLCLAMVVASQLLPGEIVTSVALAVITASVLSVLAAIFVVPSILVVLGPSLDRWSLPRRSGSHGWAAPLSARLSTRPRAVALPIVFLLIVAASWALTLDTGVGTVALLPEDDPGRRDQEAVQHQLGSGWVGPMEIAMHDPNGPVATTSRLRALVDFQRRLERDPGIATMTRFSGFERASQGLSRFGPRLTAQQRGLGRLDRGLARTRKGATLNADGLVQAASGAGRLGTAVEASGGGAGALASGLDTAGTGSRRLAGGLGDASEGSGKLAAGAARASNGAGKLADGLERAQRQTSEIKGSADSLEAAMRAGEERLTSEVEAPVHRAEESLGAAVQALREMTVGKTDARYADALRAVEAGSLWLSGVDPATGEESDVTRGAAGGVRRTRSQFNLGLYLSQRLAKNGEKAGEGVEKLSESSRKLDRGLEKLTRGTHSMYEGITRLSTSGQALPPGLSKLEAGAERLMTGLAQIGSGANGLADGLGSGAERSRLLASGLRKMHAGLQNGDAAGGSQLDRLNRRSPGLFDSAYFFLASLDGSKPEQRRRAGFLISVDRGGGTARMLVIPRYDPGDPRAVETVDRVTGDAEELAAQTHTQVLLGGITPSQLDFNEGLRDTAPLTRVVLALITMLILIVAMRSLLVPLLAAILNLLTVAATFGFLALLFDGSLLGGPGYIDTAVLPATIMVVFGLAIDYEVFVFARMREEYLRTGSEAEAISGGLAQTAPVVTGAAIIMIVVFLSFAVSSFATMRDFGVAQAIGVAIDAFMIRLIVVPAMMRALGKWAWWMPAWLDRLLPGTPNSVAGRVGGRPA